MVIIIKMNAFEEYTAAGGQKPAGQSCVQEAVGGEWDRTSENRREDFTLSLPFYSHSLDPIQIKRREASTHLFSSFTFSSNSVVQSSSDTEC